MCAAMVMIVLSFVHGLLSGGSSWHFGGRFRRQVQGALGG
jgi:hypothetical protein